jgi:hypothetical protein
MAQEEESSLLFIEIEFMESSEPHRSGGSGWISDHDAGLGVREQGSGCDSGQDSGPSGARVPEQRGAAAATQT